MATRTPFKAGTTVEVTQGDEQGQNHSNTGLWGYDFDVISGDPTIVSVTNGVVLHAGWLGPYGYAVVIAHSEGVDYYAHLQEGSIRVQKDQQIQAGQEIGTMGSTGNSTSDHLHFERRNYFGGQTQQVTFIDDSSPSSTNDGERLTSTNTYGGNDAPIDPGSGSDPSGFNPRAVLFDPVANIKNQDGVMNQDEFMFRRNDGSVTGFLSDQNGVAFWHHWVGWADPNNELIGGGNIRGSANSLDELIFRTPDDKIYMFHMDANGTALEWKHVGNIGQDDDIIGIGDITGNGRDEIIFRNGDGLGAFFMNNDGVATWRSVGNVGADQHIVGTGDITGDGRDELLFAHESGQIHAMHMNENGLGVHWRLVGNYDPDLQVVGPGDITGDGRDELLFRSDNGDIGAFFMDNQGQASEFRWIGFANSENVILGVGDIHKGAPGEEILFRNPNGDVNALLSDANGTTYWWHHVGWADPSSHVAM